MTLLDLDKEITFLLYRQGDIGPGLEQSLFIIAGVFVYLIPIILAYLFVMRPNSRLAVAKIFLSALIAWQGVGALLGGWLYSTYSFRDRPFAQDGISELLFEQPQKAFPSDHAAVMAVVALGFFLYRYPKLALFFILGGLISSLSRVMIGFHWFGDVLGGWVIGLGVMALIYCLGPKIDRVLSPIVSYLERRARWLS